MTSDSWAAYYAATPRSMIRPRWQESKDVTKPRGMPRGELFVAAWSVQQEENHMNSTQFVWAWIFTIGPIVGAIAIWIAAHRP
jgi:hypothetical protein